MPAVTLNGTLVMKDPARVGEPPRVAVPDYTPPAAPERAPIGPSPMASTGSSLPPPAGAATYRSRDVVRPTNVEVEGFARTCAELNAFPAERATILAKHGIVSEEAFFATSTYYDELIATDPALRKRFVEVGRAYYAELVATLEAGKNRDGSQ